MNAESRYIYIYLCVFMYTCTYICIEHESIKFHIKQKLKGWKEKNKMGQEGTMETEGEGDK